jgi:hypothetical protein
MSKLALVTFDLHRAPPNAYPQVQAALANNRLLKTILSRKSGKRSAMPSNTFVARFAGKWESKPSRALRKHLLKIVRNIMRSLGLRATIYVAVSKNWAWSYRRV